MTAAFISGFLLCLSLIVAIGSQNAFVLKQGLKQEHVFWICLQCSLSDAIIIAIGVFGFGAIIREWEWALLAIKYVGAIFLIVYGLLHLKSAIKGGQALITSADAQKSSLKKVLLITAALTWLNPHVYIDTVFIIGSLATKYPDTKIYFYLGNILASFLFFFSLGYGARLLQPIFRKPRSWQVLDFIIFIVMISIAISLLLE
jgi:L-lysine exporter family protein LysE/ArgO